MARLPRVVVVDVAHHVTQRGNARQVVFDNDTDRVTYLDLLRQYSELHRLSMLGYCLMLNHVHMIAIPRCAEALAQALKQTHGRYASYRNALGGSSGHVWQGRFYSCPLDDSHLWRALRYVELNPVRAGLVLAPEQWRWSSARAHLNSSGSDPWLEMDAWRKRWSPREWLQYVLARESQAEVHALRQYTHTGRPLGSSEFVASLEKSTTRQLAAQKGGRPKKCATHAQQVALQVTA
jgi:REP-associated tyrosine transposase